jgi:hypothetical protein
LNLEKKSIIIKFNSNSNRYLIFSIKLIEKLKL